MISMRREMTEIYDEEIANRFIEGKEEDKRR